MLAYLGIDAAREKETDGSLGYYSDVDLKVPAMSVQLVERLVKVHKSPHKSHRNILDLEMKFLRCVTGWMRNRSGKGGGEDKFDEMDC